ncbi:hypothetical protein EVAR_10533_1 [Eumeta japonica]|uniref:Uncharacterized protein n=1 Tax=Eumeta variegata TaxID=151549 RepID=A0A4C1TKK7_EUMVA|nr:hypothetical protein EVAR_10533_1 [Eumeta japonica]
MYPTARTLSHYRNIYVIAGRDGVTADGPKMVTTGRPMAAKIYKSTEETASLYAAERGPVSPRVSFYGFSHTKFYNQVAATAYQLLSIQTITMKTDMRSSATLNVYRECECVGGSEASVGFDPEHGRIDRLAFDLNHSLRVTEHVERSIAGVIIAAVTTVVSRPRPAPGQRGRLRAACPSRKKQKYRRKTYVVIEETGNRHNATRKFLVFAIVVRNPK